MFETINSLITVTPARLGDTLMCTPALNYLKQHNPNCDIDVIACSDLSAEILKNNPAIRQVFVQPNKEILQSLIGKYDLALITHNTSIAREYLAALEIPIRGITPEDPTMHQAEQQLRIAQSLFKAPPPFENTRYHIYPQSEDYQYVETLLNSHNIEKNKTKFIGIQMGCHGVAKKFRFIGHATHPKVWPFKSVVEFAKRLYKFAPDVRLILTGTKHEAQMAKKLIKKVPSVIDLIDKTSVQQLRALMDSLKVFITPDTGLLHVACSSYTPVVALFGPTQLSRTGPYPNNRDNVKIIRAATMDQISVDHVWEGIAKYI